MKKVKYYISLTLVLIMIFSVFSGCNSTAPGETTTDGRGTNGTGTTSATSDPADTGTAQVTGEQDTGTGGPDTGEQTEPPVQAKRDSWDADYLLELQDRVEADYRNRGEVSRELGISPNEEFLNRRFYNMNRLDMMRVHDDINRLTIRYLENELDESLFLRAPEGWYEGKNYPSTWVECFASMNDKNERGTDWDHREGFPEVSIRIEEFNVYIGQFLYDAYVGISNPDPTRYTREYTHHRVSLSLLTTTPDGKRRDFTERQEEYQKKIIRTDAYDEITPIEFRFLFDDCMLYQSEFRSTKLSVNDPMSISAFNLINDFWSVNGYTYFLRNYLLREVYGAPDGNGRYDLSKKEQLKSFNYAERYPGEEWSHPKEDALE